MCFQADFDGLEGDGDSSEDERDGDGVGFSDETWAAAERGDEVRAEEKCETGEGHQDCRGTAQEKQNAGGGSCGCNHSTPPDDSAGLLQYTGR